MSWHINPQQHSLKRKLTPKCLRITSGILWLAKYVKWQQHKTSRARLQLFEVMHVYLAVFVSNESTSLEHTNTVPAWTGSSSLKKKNEQNVTQLQWETQSSSPSATWGCFIYFSHVTNCGARVHSHESHDQDSSADTKKLITQRLACLPP